MNNRSSPKPFILFLLLGISSTSPAEERSGARFLTLGAGARELALGSASSAVADDVNALYWNPAGLARIKSLQMGFTHVRALSDSDYNVIGIAYPSLRGTIALGGLYFDHGSQEGRGSNGEPLGGFSSSDKAVSLAYSFRTRSSLNMGAAVKVLESQIGSDRATGYAFDAGFQGPSRFSKSTRFGLTVRNAGPPLRFLNQKDSLPLILAAGLQQEIHNVIHLAAEWQVEKANKNNNWVLGTEVALSPSVFVRGGYASLGGRSDAGSALSGFMGGIGVQILNHRLDYAFVPGALLQESHRISFLMSFGSAPTPPLFVSTSKLSEPLTLLNRQKLEKNAAEPVVLNSDSFWEEISVSMDQNNR